MKGSHRLGIAAGLLLAGSAVLAAEPGGFQAQFSPVAVGDAPVAGPEGAPAPDAAIVYDAAEVEAGERALAALLGEAAETPAETPADAPAAPPADTPAPVAAAPAVDAGTEAPAAVVPPPATDAGAGEVFTFAAPTEPAAEAADAPATDAPTADAPEADTGTPASEPPPEVFIDPVAEAEAQRLREEKRAARRAQQGPYVGAGGGSDHVSLAGVEDGNAPGLLAGFRYNRMLAVELALARSEYAVPGSGFADCRLDASSTGLYVAARSEESLYLKARAGLVSEAMESTGSCAPFSASDAGFSVGAGVGMRLGEAAIEFEFTQVDKEIYRLGWTVLLNF